MPLKKTGLVCRADNCSRDGYGPQNLCEKHRARFRRHGDPNMTVKAPSGYNKVNPCIVEGCKRPLYGRDLCQMHYLREYRGTEIRGAALLKQPNGSFRVDADGYQVIMENYKNIRVHRKIAEKALGKPLPKGTIVHHLNSIRTDNRTCNLVVCPDEAYHKLLHHRQREFGYTGPEPVAFDIRNIADHKSDSSNNGENENG